MTYEVINERLKRIRSIWVLDAKTCEFITEFPVKDFEAESCDNGTFCGGCPECLVAQACHYGYAVVYLDENGDYIYDPE